jgi:hypothetical protein
MIKNFELIADRLKGVKIGDKELTLDLLKEALSKEDPYELSAAPAHILMDSELKSLKERVIEENKTPIYIEGKDAGAEMLAKALKRVSSLDIEGKVKKNERGEIDFEATAKALNDAFDKTKGVEPNKKITELSESLANLQRQVEQKDNELKVWDEKYKGLEKSGRIHEVLTGKVPTLTGINSKHFLTLIKADGYSFDFNENGETVVLYNGKVVKDSYEKPLPVENVLLEYAKKNNWTGTQGRGGSEDEMPGTFKTMNDVFAHMEKNKIDPDSKQGERLIDEFEAKIQA